MGKGPKFIWMNGTMAEAGKASVPFLNSGLHYGQAVFEGIRCYATDRGPAIFRLRDHMVRLLNSAQILGFKDSSFSVEDLMRAAKDVVKANGYQACYIRPLMYLGGELPSLISDDLSTEVGIAAWEMGAYLGQEAMERGIRANVASYTRHHPNVMMTKSKASGNYTNSTLAKTESTRLGFDEAIMLDPQGYVAECTGENLFLVHKKILYTPGLGTVLEGITRDSLIRLAGEAGYTVKESLIGRDQLYTADELFVCGTAAELIAVTEVDFRKIGSGRMGPVTREIQHTFHSVISGTHPLSDAWLDYVN